MVVLSRLRNDRAERAWGDHDPVLGENDALCPFVQCLTEEISRSNQMSPEQKLQLHQKLPCTLGSHAKVLSQLERFSQNRLRIVFQL